LTAQRRPGRPPLGDAIEIRPAAVAAAFAMTPDVNGHVPNLSRECRQAYATTLLSFVKSGSAKAGPMLTSGIASVPRWARWARSLTSLVLVSAPSRAILRLRCSQKIVSAEGSMARDVFTVVLLEQQWMVRFRGRHSQRYATQGEAVTAAVEAVLATQLWSWAKSPLRDFQNAVPDESGQQRSDHGSTENDETEKLPSHGLLPAMPNFRVNPSSSMAHVLPRSLACQPGTRASARHCPK